MKAKLLILNIILLNGAFALSLGDVVSNQTLKSETNTTKVMKLSMKDATHSEYTIKSLNGSKNVLVNNNNRVYGFNWSEQNPNLQEMLGNKYLGEFNSAFKARPNAMNHRMLSIETTNLSIHQFGLPGGMKEGEMLDKNLAPK